MKRFYRKTWFWLLTAAIVSVGAAAGILAILNPTHVAETAPEHADPQLRTRRYSALNDLSTIRTAIEKLIPDLTTYGSRWKLSERRGEDSSENRETIRAEVPVVVFIDDLQIELQKEANEIVVNARSESRTGDSDLGENRRHLLRILDELDKKFGQNVSK